MRKLLYICITVLLLVPFVCLPAGAGDANVVFTLSDAEAAPGETITLTLRVDATEMYNTVGLGFCSNDGTTKYYDDVFTFLSFTKNEDTKKVSQFYSLDGNKETIVIGYNKERVTTPYSGIVCTMQFQIADDATPGVYTIGEGMSHSVKMSSTVLNSAIHPATVTVTCKEHQVKDDVYLSDANSHWHVCKDCNAPLDVAPHTEGTPATCTTKAICKDCGTSYGEIAPENHTGATEVVGKQPASCKDNGFTGDRKCVSCGTIVRQGTVMQSTGKHVDADGKWSGDGNGHWYECSCGTIYKKQEHTFAMQYDDEKHWFACTACGYRSEEGSGTHGHQNPATNDQFFKDNEKHYHICKDCGHKGNPVEHSFNENRVCVCGFADITPIEMKIQAEALDTNTQISNTDTITAILDLKQQVENAQVEDKTESDAQAEAKAIVDKLLTQIPAIGVDTVSGNSTAEVTVKNDETTATDLLANMDADDAAYLSYAMKQAKMDSANGEVVEPSFTVSVNVTMADETTKGQDVTAEFIYDAQQEATDSVLTIAAQFDITAEKTVQLGEKELKKDKITELKKEIEIGITLPKDYATVEYFILQTHYDEKTNTYTTTVLDDCDGDKHNETYVIRVDRFSLYSVYAAQSKPELKITDIEVKNGEATVKLSSAGIAKGIVITAIYTADDRMYDSHVQTANANLENPVFTYESGAYVKVFLLQDNYVPDNAHTPVKTEVTTSATAS